MFLPFGASSPLLQALSAVGGLAIPLLTGKVVRVHWAILDNFETKSRLARTASAFLFYAAVLYPAFTGWLALKTLIAKSTSLAIWAGVVDMVALLYVIAVVWFLWRKTNAEAAKTSPKKEVGSCKALPLEEPVQGLQLSHQAEISVVLEREKTMSKLVDLEASGKVISPFLQEFFSKSQDNPTLMLQRCPPTQPYAKNRDNDHLH